MAETTETLHAGSCHCGAVKFELRANIEGLMECNCSICSRAGWRLAFVQESGFTLKQGRDALQDYQFGKHHTHHLFCKTCGVRPFSWGLGEDGGKTYAVNARCLKDFDHGSLPIQTFDGASL